MAVLRFTLRESSSSESSSLADNVKDFLVLRPSSLMLVALRPPGSCGSFCLFAVVEEVADVV